MGLSEKLDAGRFVVLAETDPPKGVDVSSFTANAARVKGEVDAFVVSEMKSAVMRMSALGASLVLASRGIPCVMEVCCRDRNRLALQADLLAAAALGVTDILAVKGDDPSFGDHHEARAVNDLSLVELIEAAAGLSGGKDLAGGDLAGAPAFCAGSTVNAGAGGQALELELEELEKKRGAGACFFITPPVFDPGAISAFTRRVDLTEVRVLPTVLLLKSAGMARYLDRHIDHVHVPPAIIDRITRAGDKGAECVKIAAETVLTLKKAGFAGAMISTVGWEKKLPEILAEMRKGLPADETPSGPDTGWGRHAKGDGHA